MISLLLIFFQISFAQEKTVNVQDRIQAHEHFRQTYSSVFGKADFALSKDFKEIVQELPRSKRERVISLAKSLDPHFPAALLRALIYWREISPNPEKEKLVLEHHMMSKILVLRDYLDHPSTQFKMQALGNLRQITHNEMLTADDAFSNTHADIADKADLLSRLRDNHAFIDALTSTDLIVKDIAAELPDLTPYNLAPTGVIPGNRVELISKNDVGVDRIKWFNDRSIFAGGSLDFNEPYMTVDTHPAFTRDPIFMRIREMIDSAQESIFIDIFLFGGTMGGTLARHLLDSAEKKIQANPDFKVLFLHDFATNYNMKDEMMPVFEYLKERIANTPSLVDSVYLMQANIQRHPPGIPFGITNLIPKTDEIFPEIEKRNTYYESKIDHSKVVVIDGNSDFPKAYFGSKNWSDHSGGYYYDDAIYIEGPAAALVQASYWHDVEAALTKNPKELAWFYFKEQGFDNRAYLSKREEILDWFKIKRTHYPTRGNEGVRLAEADVDGVFKNVRNILVDMIVHADKHIYMEQLFLYDKYIVDALIKRKIQRPELDIRLIIDHNGNFGMNGLPNTIFIKELKSYGIKVRARKTLGVHAHFKDGTEREYHQENHRKISSVDGETLLGGSSNINPDTLQGSFREFGAQIFDQGEIARFERDFEKAWNDPKEVAEVDIENFEAHIGGKTLSKRFSALINSIAAQILRAKDDLERRF